MKISRLKNKFNKAGFMLSELLVVIAILGILAGISFVGVNTYIRGLQTLEMDETAKELFIAAQNHLSSAYASGEYEEELKKARESNKDVEEFGAVLTTRPDYINEASGDKTGEHEYRVITHTSAASKNKILNYMLPLFAISNEVADQGNYMIVYEANSGTVLSVFYSGNSHTGFGGQGVYTFKDGDINTDAIKEAVNSKDKRKNFTNDTVIGYFGGKNKDIVPGTKLEPLILSVSNGNKLTAIVQNPNFNSTVNADNSAQIVTLTVTGKTSGNYKTIRLANAARIEFDLDDISTPNKHFYDQFVTESHNPDEVTNGPLIPGEDIEVVALLSDNSRFANPVESNHVIDNSLFNSYNRYEDNAGKFTDDGTAIISSIRHLENLDPAISNFSKAAKDAEGNTKVKEIVAKQSADIDYSGFVADCGNTIYDGSNTSIQDYYGIYNIDLKEYDGTSHVIRNISSSSGNGGNSGIIGTVNRTGDNTNFRMKNVDLVDCSFTASAGSAGSAVGLASSPITFEYVNVIGKDNTKTINISADMGGVNAGGGLIGRTTDSLTVSRSTVSSDNLSILGNNSGGIVGYAEAACTITDSSVEGKDFNPIGNTSGGIVGKSDTSLTISKCHVSGENLNIAGNVAGGIAGLTKGKVDIKDTYSTAYVYADVEPGGNTGGGIAGGFIGSVDSPTSDSIIERCYVSGHTKNKNYAAGTQSSRETASHVDNFNIIANGITGGFIGHSDAIAVKNSYTTASVYSSNYKNLTGSKIAGGFVGTCVNLSVDNVYSAGLVSVTEGGTLGGFAGTGTISATGSNYYLRGKDSAGNGFNDVPAVGSGGTLTGVSGTAGTEISVTTAATAEPWDTELPKTYTYKTVAQLSGDNSSLNKHVGDWVVVTEDDSEKGIFIRNAEKLALVIKGNEFEGKYLSVLVKGLTSNKYYYANYHLESSGITQNVTTDEHATNINASLLNYNFKTNEGRKEYYIFYDDITTPNGAFHKIFSDTSNAGNNLKEGEDIQIIAKVGTDAYSSEELKAEGNGDFVGITNSLFADGSFNSDYEKADYYSDINPKYAIVNPPIDKNLYSGTALITNFRHLQNLDDAVSNIKSGIAFTKVKICKDLYWKDNTEIGDNPIPTESSDEDEYFKSFITAINEDQNTTGQEVDIYKWDGTATLAENSSFYGIGKDKAYNISEFDGQGHSINNLLMQPKTNSSAGIFRDIDFTQNQKFNIGDFDVNYPEVAVNLGHSGAVIGNITSDGGLTFNASNINVLGCKLNVNAGNVAALFGNLYINKVSDNSQIFVENSTIIDSVVYVNKGNAGALFGRYLLDQNNTNGLLKVEKVYSYSKNSLISVYQEGTFNGMKGGSAGGLIGQAWYGKFDISDCGAASYVYCENGREAGGFIGNFKPQPNSTVTDCFVGGHVSDSPANSYTSTYTDYADKKAVNGESTVIECQGGYNVYCGHIAGGFIGYLWAGLNSKLEINNCFSTASVDTGGKAQESAEPNKIGGFIGHIQYSSGAEFNSCYVAGRIFRNSDYVGGFVGYDNLYANETTSYAKQKFDGVTVLHGYGFNDGDLELINFHSSSLNVKPLEIAFAESDSTRLVNENASDVYVKTFNMGSDALHYPYKDTADFYDEDGDPAKVYYGDWVEPQPIGGLKIENANRLKALIYVREDTTKQSTDHPGYYETYIRIHGNDCGTTSDDAVYKVLFNRTNVIVQQYGYGSYKLRSERNSAGYVSPIMAEYNIAKGILEFSIDDIAHNVSNYRSIMSIGPYAGRPGEDITVYTADTHEKVMAAKEGKTANSIFNKLEPNDDGSGTYTAHIANSRHLQNLQEGVSAIDARYKITRVVLDDNIYWRDDGSYAGTAQGKTYNANTKPFLTEFPNASIYWNYHSGDSNGTIEVNKFVPLVTALNYGNNKITEFNGNGKTLYGFDFGYNALNGTKHSGLFATTSNNFTIHNLIICDANLTPANTEGSGGILVGSASDTLTLNDIVMYGTITAGNKAYVGGLVGSARNLIINNITMDTIQANITSSWITGGLVGSVINTDIKNVYIHGDNINISGKFYIGGMIGTSTQYGTVKIDGMGISSKNGVVSSTGDNTSELGGAIGRLFLCSVDIKNCYSSINVSGLGDSVGGFFGYVYANGSIKNCYSSAHIDNVYDITSEGNKIGGFIGSAQPASSNAQTTDLMVQNCFSSNSISSNTGKAGAFIGSAGPDQNPTGTFYIDNCYTVGKVNSPNSGAFVGKTNERVSISSCKYLDRYTGVSAVPAIGTNGNSENLPRDIIAASEAYDNLSLILADQTEGTMSVYTYPHSATLANKVYPYKNWTDASAYAGGSPLIVFFGDWIE